MAIEVSSKDQVKDQVIATSSSTVPSLEEALQTVKSEVVQKNVSIEMAGLLDTFTETVEVQDLEEISETTDLESNALKDPLDFLKGTPFEFLRKQMPALSDGLKTFGQYLAANPPAELAGTVENGSFSRVKLLEKYKTDIEADAAELLKLSQEIKEQYASPSNTACCTSSAPPPNGSEEDTSEVDEYSYTLEDADTFCRMSNNLTLVAQKVGEMSLLLTESSSESAERDSDIGTQLIDAAKDALDDVNQQIKDKEHARSKKKKFGFWSKIFKNVALVVNVAAVAPICPEASLGVGVTELVGMTPAAGYVSQGLGDGIFAVCNASSDILGTPKITKNEARLLGDILVVAVVVAAAAYCGGPGAALMAGSMMASVMPLWSDMAKCIIDLNGGKDAALIMLCTTTVGNFICLCGMVAGGMMMGSAGGIDMNIALGLMAIDAAVNAVAAGLEVEYGVAQMEYTDANAKVQESSARAKFYENLSQTVAEMTKDRSEDFNSEIASLADSAQEYYQGSYKALNSLVETLA